MMQSETNRVPQPASWSAAGMPPGGGGYGPPPGGGGYGPPPGGGGYGPPPGGGGFGPPPGGGGFGPPPGGGPPGGDGYGPPPGGYAPPPGGGGYGPPGGGGYGGPPQGFGPPGIHGAPEGGGGGSGLKTAAIVLMCVGAVLFVAGLVPCLGWVNWLGVPLNLAPIVLGIIGLTNKNKNADGSTPDSGTFIAAVVIGTIAVLGGTIRCLLGGGLI